MMDIFPKRAAVLAALGCVTACAPVGGPGVSTYYECQPPKSLKVDFRNGMAWVSVDGASAIPLKQEPAASGTSYAGGGYRLRTKGGEAIWTGLTREAPYQCRQVTIPR